MSQIMTIAGISALVLLNLYASFVVLRAASLSTTRKLLQLLVIWLLPFIGAILCISLLRTDGYDTKPDKAQEFVENVDSSGSDH